MSAVRPVPHPAPHVPRLVFTPHDRIVIGAVEYTPDFSDENGHVLRRVAAPLVTEEFSHDRIWLLSNDRDWRHDRNWFAPESGRRRLAVGATQLSDLRAREAPDVVWKWLVTTRFIEMYEAGACTKSDDDIEHALALICDDLRKLDVSIKPVAPARRARKASRAPTSTRPARQAKQGSRKAYAGSKTLVVHRQPPTPRTLHRWISILEERGFSPVSLRDGRYRSGCRVRQITGEALRLLIHHGNRYPTDERPKIRDLHRDLKAAIDDHNVGLPMGDRLTCPSRTALGLYVAGFGRFKIYAGRYGPDKAKRKFAIITSGLVTTRPYERIEMDSWEVDLVTLLTAVGLWDRLDGKTQREVRRLHFTAAIDTTTKIIVGAVLSRTPSVAAAMKVLRMALSDKRAYATAAGAELPWDQCATPEGIAMDGGPQFNNAVVINAVAWLDQSPLFPSGGVPGLRGTMESFFRTVGMQIIARFPGRTFENVVAKGDYDAEGRACLFDDEQARILTRWIVDAYHGSPHDGLAGETPIACWNRLTQMRGITKAPDRHKLRAIFGIPLVRTLGSGGIRVMNLRYWCEPLVEHFLHHGEVEMDVKLDPDDLGELAVCIDGTWHAAACTSEQFEDVTLEAWIRASRDLARTHVSGAAVTQAAVNAALVAANTLSREASARFGIASVPPTEDDIARAERELMLGWTMPAAADVGERSSADPLDGGYPVSGREDRQPGDDGPTEDFDIEE
ncbi:Mu transposase C-terminal domain-containing protein [Methylobacterium pseudosasicola]|uniref:Putative transposase n=1 Tax=Methylobacterium pseudosasicola TaxID=582667 RepID=A0A1I4P6K0_9HYPH|nr:Mu transposase C-terminal domain-containing protein [Methylobacterium pseudosasicola]SFM23484.1 putative transposase [Methylobacterium pseudosasicola]